ncbi:MAG TPA: GAF domain-containing protein, partial [Roseiflexaceae bacterium]|nr:GAF domain-containing protein [Roseiflexaceae bacterium]
MSPELTTSLRDPNRLAALHRLDLLGSPQEEAFDRLARLTARMLRAPIALISLLDADRQFIKSGYGLPDAWAAQHYVPIELSLCQSMVALHAPLAIADIHALPQQENNPGLQTFGYVAYAGAPLIVDRQYVVGSLCVLDTV